MEINTQLIRNEFNDKLKNWNESSFALFRNDTNCINLTINTNQDREETGKAHYPVQEMQTHLNSTDVETQVIHAMGLKKEVVQNYLKSPGVKICQWCSVLPQNRNIAYMLGEPMRIGMISPQTKKKLVDFSWGLSVALFFLVNIY